MTTDKAEKMGVQHGLWATETVLSSIKRTFGEQCTGQAKIALVVTTLIAVVSYGSRNNSQPVYAATFHLHINNNRSLRIRS